MDSKIVFIHKYLKYVYIIFNIAPAIKYFISHVNKLILLLLFLFHIYKWFKDDIILHANKINIIIIINKNTSSNSKNCY